jgi:hypothetical protein
LPQRLVFEILLRRHFADAPPLIIFMPLIDISLFSRLSCLIRRHWPLFRFHFAIRFDITLRHYVFIIAAFRRLLIYYAISLTFSSPFTQRYASRARRAAMPVSAPPMPRCCRAPLFIISPDAHAIFDR